jgi:hypothetical protein
LWALAVYKKRDFEVPSILQQLNILVYSSGKQLGEASTLRFIIIITNFAQSADDTKTTDVDGHGTLRA